jgi:hypothetical protein
MATAPMSADPSRLSFAKVCADVDPLHHCRREQSLSWIKLITDFCVGSCICRKQQCRSRIIRQSSILEHTPRSEEGELPGPCTEGFHGGLDPVSQTYIYQVHRRPRYFARRRALEHCGYRTTNLRRGDCAPACPSVRV